MAKLSKPKWNDLIDQFLIPRMEMMVRDCEAGRAALATASKDLVPVVGPIVANDWGFKQQLGKKAKTFLDPLGWEPDRQVLLKDSVLKWPSRFRRKLR